MQRFGSSLKRNLKVHFDGELERGVVAAKDLSTGTQEEWAWDQVGERLGAS